MTLLEHKTAIITGAGGGIGSAIGRHFARAGAEVIISDIDARSAESCAAGIRADGGNALAATVDVTNKQSVGALTMSTLARSGKIDILVNVAGGAEIKPVIEMSEADWDRVVDLNLKSVFLCSQAVLPAMLSRRYGKIVSISSIYGFTGNATRSSYAAAKAGVAVFTKSLALEVAREGINVNAIAPGRVATERVRGHYSEEEWAERVAAIPMRRAAGPEQIAPTALFLVLDENSYITGQTIHVNGAWLNW